MRATRAATLSLSLFLAGAAHAAASRPDSTAAPKLSAPPAWSAPTPTDGTTAAGTRVVVLSERQLPLVHLLVTISAGSALDPPAHPGLAATTAMMVQEGGAGSHSAPQLEEAIADLGGELEIRVDRDEVQLSLTVLARNLERALALLGDIVARPRFDPGDWARAQASRIATIRRLYDEPRYAADVVFERALYGEHPYAHPPLGTPASIAAIGLDDVRKFYAAHYGPRTVAFVLDGDATQAAAVTAVERALGEWKSSAAPPAAIPSAPVGPPRLVVVDRPGAPQSELRVGHVGRDRKTGDYAALELLQTVLGGSFTSRLNQNLREKHGYSYGARAQFDLWRAAGPFTAGSAVRTDATAASLTEIVAELVAIRVPLSADEAAKGRALVLSAIIEGFGDGAQTSGLFADLIVHGLPLDSWSRVPAELAALTVQQLTQAAARLFAPDRLTIVVMGDRKLIDAELRKLPFAKNLEYRDLDGKPVK